ncbi:hypothetical protein K435DRAFT_321041 [Dendrothele bispora CBS 962.96]|uniref:Uncharacterized protein n=1 Tax=Dendrothele bispora (strain CBS 962.96) TaxID=1314807 RepID=A0A4S8MJ66_DENBC|nr:hypothetical protein K435DRAFT_321041 [Dendrothele bispora CBS 962.96]
MADRDQPASTGLFSGVLNYVTKEVGSFVTNATGGVITVVRYPALFFLRSVTNVQVHRTLAIPIKRVSNHVASREKPPQNPTKRKETPLLP